MVSYQSWTGDHLQRFEVPYNSFYKEDGHFTKYETIIGPAIVLQEEEETFILKGFNSLEARDKFYEILSSSKATVVAFHPHNLWHERLTMEEVERKIHVVMPRLTPYHAVRIAVDKAIWYRKRYKVPFKHLGMWDAFIEYSSIEEAVKRMKNFNKKDIKLWANTLAPPMSVLQCGITPLQYWEFLVAVAAAKKSR